MTLLFTQGHNCVSNWTMFLTCTIAAMYRTVFINGIHIWHDGRLMHGIYAHTRFNDLYLDARSQGSAKARQSVLNSLGNKASNKHYTCCNGRPVFYVTLTLNMFILLNHLGVFFQNCTLLLSSCFSVAYLFNFSYIESRLIFPTRSRLKYKMPFYELGHGMSSIDCWRIMKSLFSASPNCQDENSLHSAIFNQL